MNELIKKLEEFKGVANEVSKSVEDKIADLEEQFMNIATYLIYGGHFHCSDRYDLYITGVEFYYHEEVGDKGNRIVDPIMYHRNYVGNNYFPEFLKTATFYPHESGIDITFEDVTGYNEKEKGKYRASALIRSYYVVNKGIIEKEDDHPKFVYDYLFDGISACKSETILDWIDHKGNLDNVEKEIETHRRINVHKYMPLTDLINSGISKDCFKKHDNEYAKMKDEDDKKWRFVKKNSLFNREYKFDAKI